MAKNSEIDVSLVLCTKNGGERLRTCLSYIEALDDSEKKEIILVDNGSTDNLSFGILKEFAEASKHDCIVLQTFVPGNSAGRNIALQQARGKYWLFIDDDCYAAPDFVSQWCAVFDQNDIGYGSGRIMIFDPNYSALGCFESPDVEIVPPHSFIRRGFVQGSNMAFRASFFDAVGPFDIRFGAGTPYAGEEWDVVLQGALKGIRGGYFPGPTVSHDHRRAVGPDEYQRMLFYDYGAGAVYAKHAFGRNAVLVFRKFLAEACKFRRSRGRLKALLSGYMRFMFISRWQKAALEKY